MTITAKIILDSISPDGIRLTTMQLRYPKFIHGEFMTHRVFSRNASSSRAIPVERLIQDVLDDPAMPVYWGSNKPGMQAGEELSAKDEARMLWLRASYDAIGRAQEMAKMGAHKQIVNRIIEPYCHINVVVTATEWDNFYTLRRHPDAQPEMCALADAMWEAQCASTPNLICHFNWHLPYCSSEDVMQISNMEAGNRTDWLVQCSVARCARVSYLTHEGKKPNVEDDLKLYIRLVGSVPLHASPAEHQAMPDSRWDPSNPQRIYRWEHPEQHGNLRGWRQYRKMIDHLNT